MTETSGDLFVIPGAIDVEAAQQAIGGLGLRIEPMGPSNPFTILDCHDQSLRKSGCLLIETARKLRLLQPNGRFVVQSGAGAGRFVPDLQPGPVREALAGFPPLRALMSVGGGTVDSNALTVLDELQKTVLRGFMIVLTSGSGQVTLVSIQKLRGYDRAYDTMRSALTAMAGADGGFEAAYRTLFPDLVPYEAKPHIPLGKTEPAIEAATDIIRTFLTVARQNEAGVIADTDTEFLHDYRVSLRRIRSVLSLFKSVFSEDETARLKHLFSDLMDPTGRLRDLDVYLLEKSSYFSLLPPSLHAGLEEMFSQFETDRARALSRLSRRLRSAAYDKDMRDLAARFQDISTLKPGPNANLGAYDYARSLIWKRYRKVCKLARSITPETPDQAVHDLRILCKKLRYLMEFFAPLFDVKAFKAIIKPLKKLQDNLGLFNDYSVQQETLLAFIDQQSARAGQADAQLSMAAGGLIAVLDQRQKAERDRVLANFEHFDSPDIRRLFRTLFHTTED